MCFHLFAINDNGGDTIMTVKKTFEAYAEEIDRSIQATLARMTGGISPAAFMLAFTDWISHLAIHPTKQLELLELLEESLIQFYIKSNDNHHLPEPIDKRFKDKSWQQFPYSYYYQSFLAWQNWWHTAATNVRGVSRHHQDVVDFSLRQFLDVFSPANSALTNPEVQKVTVDQQGANLINGWKNFLDDWRRQQLNEPPAAAEQFVIGKNMAVTPGKVIYRNQLMELIQYKATTKQVYAEPILITPAWIMKYYILDLTPKHSLVKYLVDKGHTVFIISWKNPTNKDRHIGMNDYLQSGIISALDVINAVIPNKKIHLLGYCLGGTLSAIATATLARENSQRLASMILLAAQTDFTEPGELGLFIDESQITFLENMMRDKGYLDTHQMSGAFQLLRSNDLIWSRIIHDYLFGVRKPLKDLMAWNADTTRLPYKMHSEYLRNLFLNNQLAEGHYLVDGKPIALSDIDVPIFVVATERDHVSPWRSVFKINLLTDEDVTFVLTSGGHNVGIVSMPVKKTKRYYRVSTLKESDRYIDPDSWYEHTKIHAGSWWPILEKWITKHSSKTLLKSPTLGSIKSGYKPLEPAPGLYIFEK